MQSNLKNFIDEPFNRNNLDNSFMIPTHYTLCPIQGVIAPAECLQTCQKRKLWRLIFLIPLFMMFPALAHAVTYYFVAASGAAATLTTNWNSNPSASPGVSPGNPSNFTTAGDRFEIPAGKTAVVFTGIWGFSGGTSTVYLGFNSILRVEDGASVNLPTIGCVIDATASLCTIQLVGSGQITGTGSISYSSGSILEFIGTVAHASNVPEIPLTMPGSVICNNAGGITFTPGGAQTFSGTITIQDGAFTIFNPSALDFNGAVLQQAGTFTINSLGGNVNINNTLTLNSGTLSINNAPLINTGSSGAITVNGGTATFNSIGADIWNGSCTVNNTGQIIIGAGGSVTLNGAFTGNGSGLFDIGTSDAFTMNSTITLASTFRFQAPSGSNSLTIGNSGAISGDLQFDAANNNLTTLTINRPNTPVRLSGTLNSSNLNVQSGSTLTINSGTANALNLTNVGSSTLNGTISIDSMASLRIRNSHSFTIGGSGTVNVDTHGAFTLEGGTINNLGTVRITGGTFSTKVNPSGGISGNTFLYAGNANHSSTLRYAMNANFTATTTEFPATMLGTVDISSISSAYDLNLPANFNPLVSSFKLSNARLVFDNGGNTLTINDGLITLGTGAVFTPPSIAPGNTNSGIVINGGINGAAPITGNWAFSSALPFLTLNRAGQRMRLNSSLTISAGLSLQNGIIEVPAGFSNTLLLTGQAALVSPPGTATSYVDGRMDIAMPASLSGTGQFRFAVGRGSVFVPLHIINTSTGVGGATVAVIPQAPPANPTLSTGLSALDPDKFWSVQVTSGSFTSGQLQFTASDIGITNRWVYSLAYPGTYNTQTATTVDSTITTSMLSALSSYFGIGNTIPPPTITSISPALMGTGGTITITGTGFQGVRQVYFGGTLLPTTSYTIPSTTQILVVLRDSVPSGTVRVVAGGGSVTSTQMFTFAPPPVITGFTPPETGAGKAVLINGSNFLGTVSVSFGGVAAQSATTNSTSQILAYPSAKGTSGTIVVGAIGGTTASQSRFRFVEPPTIRSFSPTLGGANAFISILGTNFVTGATTVFFGGVPAGNVTVNSDRALSVVLGTGATGKVEVRSLGGIATSATIFGFITAPVITSFTPLVGGIGTVMEIRGRGLGAATDVVIGGAQARSFEALSDTLIRAVVGEGSGTQTVRVLNPAGGAISAESFTFIPPPSISQYSPTFGTGGTVITITGTNFRELRSVTISGLAARSYTVVSTTEIVAVVGRISGSGKVVVQTAGGTATADSTFRNIVFPPVIESINPLSGTTGTLITLVGKNFSEVNTISIAGVPVFSFTIVSDTLIRLTLPPTAKSGKIQVTSSGGTSETTSSFTFFPPPIITSVVPPLASPGSTVVITGVNFDSARSVQFGGVPAERYTIVSPTRIVAVIAGGRSGSLTVATPNGSTAYQREFLVLPALQIDSLALVQMYETAGGANWANKTNWLSSAPLGRWFGITVENNRVRKIELPANNLTGELPPSLSALTELQVLSLNQNGLTGAVPDFLSVLTNLNEIRLDSNQFTGTLPDSIGNLKNLRVLNLANNTIIGNLPATFCQLLNLTELNLSNNNLTGTISACIGSYTGLITLNLSRNRFTDSIPAALGNLVNLRNLLLHNNQLSGVIPQSLGGVATAFARDKQAGSVTALPVLQVMNLSNNRLTGSIPTPMGLLSGLKDLNLSNNRLSGAITPTMLTKLSSLENLDVSFNNLSGALPATIGTLTTLKTLILTKNQFSDTLPPTLGGLSALTSLMLDSNRFRGVIPDSLRSLRQLRTASFAANQFTALPRLSEIRRLLTLNVASNALLFANLEDNVVENFNLIYAPQDSVGKSSTQTGLISLPFRLSLSVPGANNRYQWFRNGTAITTASTDTTLGIPNFAKTDEGQYICRITNATLPDLTLVSRVVQVQAALPPVPSERITLTFPADKAFNISTRPRLRWGTLSNASDYEISVSSSPAFTADTITITSTVGLVDVPRQLANSAVYYWRVRARNAGGSGPWSEVFSFTVAPSGLDMVVTSLNFGRTVIGEKATARAEVVNLTSQRITLRSVTITGDTFSEFAAETETGTNGLVINPNGTVEFIFSFNAKAIGQRQANAVLRYDTQTTTGKERIETGLLSGLGAPLKVIAADFDTVLVGRTTLTTALISNEGSSPLRVEVSLRDSASGVFSIDPDDRRAFYLASKDTVSVLMRANPAEAKTHRGKFFIKATEDSTSGDILAHARFQRFDDIIANVMVRPYIGQDTIPPGDLVKLELIIDRAALNKIKTSRLSTAFRASFRFNRRVLTLSDKERRAQAEPPSDARNFIQRIEIPPAYFDFLRRDTTQLDTIQCVSVLGDVDRTTLRLERFEWGSRRALGQNNVPFEPRVFANFTDGVFVANVCKIDGVKRLITSAGQGTALMLMMPNPSKDVTELTYSLREPSQVQMTLVDMSGKTLKVLLQGQQEAGAYSMSIKTTDLPAGMYYIVLDTPTRRDAKPLQVVR